MKRQSELKGCFSRLGRVMVLLMCLQVSGNVGGAESVVAPGATLQKLGEGFKFTEGPAADWLGNVYFTDQPNDRIVKWDAVTGQTSDWLKPAGRSNGMYFDAEGNLITCADGKNQLWSISPDKEVRVLVKEFGGKLLNGPNDLWIHPNGDIYFTDPLYKRNYWERDGEMQQEGRFVYRIAAGGDKPEIVARDFKQPNGIVGSSDGKLLYVADINGRQTFRFQIEKDGSLSNRHKFCDMGSDGMALDAMGNLYLTGRGVTVFNPAGEKIHHIDIPEGWTANVTFGGLEHRTLFVTAMGSIYGLQMNVAGDGIRLTSAPSFLERTSLASFGKMPDGREVTKVTLKNARGMQVEVINYGAIVTSIMAPDREGEFGNVIAGSDSLDDYLRGFPSAAVIGRFANRIANASFSIGGEEYKVTVNNGKNHIHGGRKGFAKVLWEIVSVGSNREGSQVTLRYLSRDGEEGFPGNLETLVTYSLDDNNTLHIRYEASTDKPTIVNLTNHAYFNLGIDPEIHPIHHELYLKAYGYTEVNDQLIPTGTISPVKGTPLDFTSPKMIGRDIDQITQFRRPIYDHNFVLGTKSGEVSHIARVVEPRSGRVMDVMTDQPGVQLYTGNNRGLCLETQHYPDAINHPHFPSPIVRPGRNFESVTAFRFSVKQ